MKKKFFVDYDYQTKTIFRMSLAFVTFLNLPFFLINDSKIILCRCLLVFLCSHIFYLFVFDKTLIQINLLLMLRHPLFIDYFSFVNKKTCFLNSSFRIFVFFCFLFFLFFLGKTSFFFFFFCAQNSFGFSFYCRNFHILRSFFHRISITIFWIKKKNASIVL